MTSPALLASALALLAAPPAPPAADAPLFAYDRSRPVAVKEVRVQPAEGSEAHELVITGAGITYDLGAWLVVPTGNKGPSPAVVYLHMYPGSKDQFLDEARLLAREGVVSILLEGYFPWHRRPADIEPDRIAIGQQGIHIQRAVDLLASRKDVDPKRIALVGIDYGGMHVAVAASVEKRIKAFAILSAAHAWTDWNPILNGDTMGIEYADGLESLDPLRRIAHASAPLLFQFCTKDRFISREFAERLIQAAPEPKTVKWYDGDHEASFSTGQKDRLEWLRAQLALPAR